jgi:membrane-associated protease RseP (regulator of RpoE activity)
MNFFYIDLALLIFFCIFVTIFLYKNKKKVKREGLFFLYKTKHGLKFMDNFSKRFSKQLKVISYISITFGYVAMIAMIALLIDNVVLLAKMPEVIKAPPIMPVIPYAPQIFKVPNLPNFYFIHWIIIIAILAITHEFAHGIFARLYKIKVKSTGFGFLGPLPLAFVELDDKQMAKKKNKAQLSVLSAGSFSNFVFLIIFGLIFLLILSVSFHATTPLYAGTMINATEIKTININQLNYSLSEIKDLNLIIPEKITVYTENQSFILTKDLFLEEKSSLIKPENQTVIVYYNAPLINADIKGEILEINGIKTTDKEIFNMFNHTSPGQEIDIKTTKDTYRIIAAQNPGNSSKGFIGISYRPESTSFIGKIQDNLMRMKNPFMNYESFNKDIFSFISLLFFWLLMFLFAVSTLNMLPFAFFDGGKFFFITMLALTKSKKKAELSYKIANIFIILIILAMMLVWAYRMWLFKLFI